MAYCHECGEQIAPEDIFCPYCGISLKPLVQLSETTEPAAEDNAQGVVSVTVPSPIEMPVEPIAEPEVVVKEASLPSIPEDFESSSSLSDPSPKNDTAEHLYARTEEVPELQQHISVGEPQEISSAAEESKDEQIPVAVEKEPFVQQISEPVSIPKVSEDVQVEQPSFGEIVGENSTGETDAAAVPEPSFDATIPYAPGEFPVNLPGVAHAFQSEPVKAVQVESAQEESVADEPQKQVEAVQGNVFTDEPQKAVQENAFTDESQKEKNVQQTPDEADADMEPTLISSPFISLENEQPQSLSEGQTESGQVGEPQISEPVQTETPPPASESSPSQQDLPEAHESRPYTSPNVNAVDTGGKKTKLKTLSEGTVLNGRYEIIRKIGGGGMGAVYLASDRNLGGILRAVKEMVQSHIEEEQQEKAINDFKRESLLLSSLEHPAIPTIFDYFYDDKEGRFYLVMKYISGGDLAARLRSSPEGRLDEKSVTEMAIQIADVLDYLHNRQPPIVYRDLKPSNIMIDGNTGKVMLIDFGIARWVNKEEKGVTAVGTMGYAPPELFSGNVEPRSDIYSLGSTMFHLLTGADPQNNPLLIFDFNKNPRPRQINPSLSDQIEQILMRAVEYNVEKRFTSARELRDVLNRHLMNLETGRVTYGAGDRGAVAVPTADVQTVFCGFCGQKILANDLFCPFCGAKQPLAAAHSAAPMPAPPVYSAPKLTAKLFIVNTNELETPVFNLEKDSSLLGRRDPMSNIFPEVDLSKFDPQTKISRRHARIWREGEKFMVEDLGSSNGTVLLLATNESVRLLPRQPRVLSNGDRLKLGDTTLHFVVG